MTYVARPVEIAPAREGVWATLEVHVVRAEDGVEVGSYLRNYPALFDTFHPFTRQGRELALYSPHYTGTRVMELPSCRDLGGEEPAPEGFCPVDYFVPDEGDVGFVAGCVWGDDTSWKIQALDLSGVESGAIARDERFGLLELPEGKRLGDVVSVKPCHPHAECEGSWVEMTVVVRFEAATGRPLRSSDV